MSIIKVNYALNVGEVSARFEARQDKIEKYGAACRVLENWLPLTMGGVTRRPGWAFVAKAKFSGQGGSRVVLVDFRFSSTQAYVLEFGALYVRFFKDGAPLMDPMTPSIPLELVTPYTIDDLDRIKIGVFQSADVMYICTGIYAVHKIIRTDANPDDFTITPVNFQPPATIEDEPSGTEINAGGITLGALTGNGVTATAANSVFIAGDVGRVFSSGAGRAIVTAQGGTTLTIDIIDAFNDLTINDADWHFEGFGNATMNLSRREAGDSTSMTASIATFRTTDVNKYMTIFGGLVQIKTVASGTAANGTILNTLRDVPNDPSTGLPFTDPPATSVWSIEVKAWTDALGYPNCGCFFQGRMWLCKGQQINGSVSGDFENFSKGSNADDAIQRTIDDDQVNPIRWIKGLRTLQPATGGSAYEVTASTQGKALSPSDFTGLPISSRGSANIPPVKVGGQLIYVQFGQKKLRELVFDFVTDKFKSPSLFILAEHLTETNFVVDCTYQQEPDSIIWAARDDGKLLALTYQEDENVIAWSTHPTTGNLIALTNIPRPSTGVDWVWGAIEREINGVIETYIEFMEPDADVDRQWHGLQTDSAKVATPDADFVVSGADHLEGSIVRVIGDGMLFNDAVVSGGEFTLDPPIAVEEVEYGLDYQSNGLTIEPPISAQEGGMFLCRRWKHLGMRVRHAGPGLTLNVSDSLNIGLPVRKPYHPMDRALPLQEGKLCATQTNWGPFARVAFKQTLPFPAEVMNIIGALEIGTEWCCDTEDELVTFGTIPLECDSACPVGQFARAVYNGAMTIGGPAIRVNPNSSNSSAFLVAALYFPTLSKISIVWYNGESNQEIGTVLASTSYTLAVDDVLEIKAGVRIAGVIQFTAYVNNVAVVGPVGDENIPEDASCATFWVLSGIGTIDDDIFLGDDQMAIGSDTLAIRRLE